MQRTSFMLGVALLVVAATIATTITLRKPTPVGASAPKTSSRSGPSPETSPAAPDSSRRAGSLPAKSARGDLEPERFTVAVPQDHPQRGMLVEQARKVEAQATARLERLAKRLDLTGVQQRKLFPILARTSEAYDPAMTISGRLSGAAPLLGNESKREFDKVLDETQKDQLIEDAMNDDLLWQAIIENLQERLKEQTPKVPAAPTTEPVPPETEPVAPETETVPLTPRRRGRPSG